MPDPTLKDVLDAPAFYGLPRGEQFKALRSFPEFQGLPLKEQGTFLAKAQQQYAGTTNVAPSQGPAPTGLKGFASGISQGAAGTVSGVMSMLPGKAGRTGRELHESPVLQPRSTSEKLGKATEQTAEYFVPAVGEEEIAAKGLAGIAKSALQSGLKAGAVGTAQTGSLKEGAVTGMTAGATAGVMHALSPVIGALGRKIQMSTVKPRLIDVKDGFKVGTLGKYGIHGNLEQSLQQVDGKLTELRNARNAMLAPGTANVDIDQVFKSALADVTHEAGNLKFGAQGRNAIAAVKDMLSDLKKLNPSLSNADIRQAENLKEFLGTLGSWAYGRGDPDAKVTELVANTLYSKMRESIEKSLLSQGADVKALNKQMQELIPVKNAMLARIPVEQRNLAFSLSDLAAMLPAVATGDVSLLSIEGLNRAQKSLRFGNFLVNKQKLPLKAASAAGRLAGSAESQVAR